MCITEYDEAKVLAAQKAEGATEGKLELLVGLDKDKLLSFSEADPMMDRLFSVDNYRHNIYNNCCGNHHLH